MTTLSATARIPESTLPAAGRRKARLIAVIGAVLAALLMWGPAKVAVSDLRQPAFGSAKPHQLNAAIVIATASIASLLGWSVMASLEHLTSRPRRSWAMIARLALVLMHLTVAGIIIPILYRTSRATETAGPR